MHVCGGVQTLAANHLEKTLLYLLLFLASCGLNATILLVILLYLEHQKDESRLEVKRIKLCFLQGSE